MYMREHDRMTSMDQALATLANTPRTLKSMLRAAIADWEQLAGEVDIDALITVSALREAEPEIHEFVDEHLPLFQHGFRSILAADADRKPHPVESKLNEIISGQDAARARAIRTSLDYLFPTLRGPHAQEGAYLTQPQAVHVDRHANYWRRLKMHRLADGEEPDQKVLDDIVAWKRHENARLVDRMVSGDGIGAVETFAQMFTADEIAKLLDEVARSYSRSVKRNGWGGGAPAGQPTIAVWRMVHALHAQGEPLNATIEDLCAYLVPEDVPLCVDLMHYFLFDGGSVSRLVPPDRGARIGRRVLGGLGDLFAQHAGTATARLALKGGTPWALVHAIRGCLRLVQANEPEPQKPNAEVANALSNCLSALSKQDRELAAILVAGLVTDFADRPEDVRHQESALDAIARSATVNRPRAQAILKDRLLASLFTDFSSAIELDSQLAAACRVCVEAFGRHGDSSRRA